MGNFRNGGNGRKFGGSRGSSRGRSGGFGGNKDSSGGFSRRRDSGGRNEMHNAVCDKCGEKCQVPFKPTGNKPVLCSNCFRKGGDSGSFSRDRESRSMSGQSDQFSRIEAKLDKILGILQELEIDTDGSDEDDSDED